MRFRYVATESGVIKSLGGTTEAQVGEGVL
jgi:hypothetical protein